MSWTTDAVLYLAAEMPADVPPIRKSSFDICILDECPGKNCTASISMASGDVSATAIKFTRQLMSRKPDNLSKVSLLACHIAILTAKHFTMYRHAFELVDFFEYGKLKQVHGTFPMQLFEHLPYAANPKLYYPLQNWEDKSVDYLDVDGVLGDSDKTRTVTPEEYRQAKLCLFDRYVYPCCIILVIRLRY